MISVCVVIKDGTDLYYLLKVEQRGRDIYCFIPDLGVHYSVHKSGEAHFRSEGKATEPEEGPPVVLVEGEAGTLIDGNTIRSPLCGVGRAAGICTGIYLITSLSDDFRKFNRSEKECFVIDTVLLSKNTKSIVIGVWTVPARNEVSFQPYNPNIPAGLLYKVAQYEPQIWIYAQPC